MTSKWLVACADQGLSEYVWSFTMFNSKSSLATLAQLLLKSHHELNEFFSQTGAAQSNTPFNFGVRLGKSEGSMSVDQAQDGFVLAFTEDDRSYKLVLEPRKSAAEPFKLKVTLLDGDNRQEHLFDGTTLFSAKMPEEFQALHARVRDYLKAMLPKELWAQFETAPQAGPRPAAAAPEPSTTTAGETAAFAGSAPASTGSATAQPQETDPFEWFVVRRQGQPDLRFKGKLIARVDSTIRRGRKTIFQVFQTPSGKFVGIELGVSYWAGERDLVNSLVTDNLESLVSLFGYSHLAKALYSQLALATEEVIE